MDNIIIWVIIILGSFIMGFLQHKGHVLYDVEVNQYKDKYKKAIFAWKFIELWNSCISYFIGGVIIYYFVAVRWQVLSSGASMNIVDFILWLSVIMSFLGYLPYFLKNITEGINNILTKALKP